MPTNIRVSQINLQHGKASSYLLAARLAKLQDCPYIFLIQEPWVRFNKIGGIGSVKGTRIFFDKRSSKPRSCVLMSKLLDATMLTQFCSYDLVAVNLQYRVNGKRRNVIVPSAYLPYASLCPPPPQELRDLVVYIESSGLELLTGCDANAQHICWDCGKCNPRGKKLFDFITFDDRERRVRRYVFGIKKR